MAWQFSVNNLVTGGNDQNFTFMKQLVALGFTVAGSGDGTGGSFENIGQTAGPYDIWTQTGVGTGSYTAGHNGNSNAWFRIRFPDGVRELIVHRYGQYSVGRDDEWKMYYSKTGFDGNDATATLPPSASAVDEIFIFGTTPRSTITGFVNVYLNSAETAYVHVAAESVAVNGFYAFYLLTHRTTTGTAEVCLAMDALSDVVPADPEPYVVIAAISGFTAAAVTNEAIADTPPGAWTNGVWQHTTPLSYSNRNSGLTLQERVPSAQGINPVDSTERLYPIIVGGSDFYKGIEVNFRWVPTGARAYPDTYASQTFLVSNTLALPWDGATTPLV